MTEAAVWGKAAAVAWLDERHPGWDEVAVAVDLVELCQRVERGVAWLDEHRPGWVERIDLERLDLGELCNCILGQERFGDFRPRSSGLSGGFWTAVRLWGDGDFAWAVQRGFAISDADTEDDTDGILYALLTSIWRDLIVRRRAEATAAVAAMPQ